eukprot:10597506-Alexandrium_andersonii.AAC.1
MSCRASTLATHASRGHASHVLGRGAVPGCKKAAIAHWQERRTRMDATRRGNPCRGHSYTLVAARP